MNAIIFVMSIFPIGIFSRELKKEARIDYINVSYFDPDYLNYRLEVRKLDRKINSVNFSMNVLKEITSLKGRIVLYKFVDNVYKATAYSYSGDFCKLLDIIQAKYPFHENNKFKHIMMKCPVKKGHYYTGNFSGKDFGVAIFPTWKMKCEYEMGQDNEMLMQVYIIFTIVEE